jgi:hypothetical protein
MLKKDRMQIPVHIYKWMQNFTYQIKHYKNKDMF